MSGFLTKQLLTPLFFASLALPAWAQSPDPSQAATDRDASFLPSGTSSTNSASTSFSGLAAAPASAEPVPLVPQPVRPVSTLSEPTAAPLPAPITISAPISVPLSAPAPTIAVTQPPSTEILTAVPQDKATADISAAPVIVAPLPNVSADTVGTQSADGLGTGMWKNTPRPVAETILSIATLTTSPVLNNLAHRLLVTAAVPPEGTAETAQSLTSMRIEKLVTFGAASDAWALVKDADPATIDDITYHLVIENILANDDSGPCASLPTLSTMRTSVDWQKSLVICELLAKDAKAQVGLDVMRAQTNRDPVFLEVADKNILGTSKVLPTQLTPLTPSLLAVLRLTGLPLPGELYGHPDFALASSLVHAPAKQDVAQLGLAERAVARGIISTGDLENIYRTINFSPDELTSPLTAVETGLRLRALLFRAAESEKDSGKRVGYVVKFVQSATPEFLNGTSTIGTDMLGDVKPDAAFAENAMTVAYAYMLAGQSSTALAWLKLAKPTAANAQESQNMWPQFALAGMETDSGYAADLGRWLDAALKPTDPQADMHAARERAAGSLLLLDAAGYIVPDTAWAKVLIAPHNEKHSALSATLLERLQVASAANRSAETVLLAVDLAGDNDISLPAAAAITRALRLAGFKAEASIFARQMVSLLAKSN